MKYQFSIYHIPLFASFFIILSLSVYGYRQRSNRVARSFAISMLTGVLWAFAYSMELAGIDFSTKFFWSSIQYISFAFAPVTWLIVVLQFTDRAEIIKKKYILLVSIIPIITNILVWTDPMYGLLRYDFTLDRVGDVLILNKSFGTWFWIHCVYSYLLNFSSFILLFKTALAKNSVHKKQALYLLTGLMVLLICNLLYVAGLSPLKGVDISPISFSISGLIIYWGIFKNYLFNIVPIARETVIENMGSGIVVIDMMKRVIDVNPQAINMLGINEKVKMGEELSSFSAKLFNLISSNDYSKLLQTELSYKESVGENRCYEIHISPLKDYNDEHIAWVIILNDISDLKQAREKISIQQQELAVMDERERMARDLHDNLGQVLSFSSIQIQAVRQELKKDNKDLTDQYLDRLNCIIKDAHKDIREYVYNIRDNSLYNKDLITILNEEIGEFKNHFNMQVDLLADKDCSLEKLGIEEKLQLIHIVKEALTNSLKYAEADNIVVSLKTEGQFGELVVADNGKGIDISNNRGSGLNIMNERARLISGHLKIESTKGIGAKIICTFPI